MKLIFALLSSFLATKNSSPYDANIVIQGSVATLNTLTPAIDPQTAFAHVDDVDDERIAWLCISTANECTICNYLVLRIVHNVYSPPAAHVTLSRAP